MIFHDGGYLRHHDTLFLSFSTFECIEELHSFRDAAACAFQIPSVVSIEDSVPQGGILMP